MIQTVYVKGLVVLAAFVAGAVVNGWRYDVKIANIEKAYQLEVEQSERKTRQIADQYMEALNNARTRENEIRLAADGARSELDRLRVTIKKRSAAVTASPASAVDYSIASSDVFGECAAELTALAGKADGHTVDLKTMIEAWPANPR
jgi:hypothetical protein